MNSAGGLRGAAWDHFLIGKRRMLARYREARAHAQQLIVQTHHGVVAEAEFRAWLEAFLPKRYGVTSGYVRAQTLRSQADNSHFDVIVYDQIESPVLWQESDPDRSTGGRARIIPAEYVRAVIEVKSAFSRRTFDDCLAKLEILQPLMDGVDRPSEPYRTYLPGSVVLAAVFFELRRVDSQDLAALKLVHRAASLKRVFYGPIILSGEGRPDDDTASLRVLTSDEEIVGGVVLPEGLLANIYMSGTEPLAGSHVSHMLTWSPLHFAEFAFDVLAFMNGTYRRGFLSSFYGLDLSREAE